MDESDDDIDVDAFLEAERRAYEMPISPPPMDFRTTDFLQHQAILAVDKGYISKFYRELLSVKMETCGVCNRRWFDMGLTRHGVCKVCVADLNKHGDDDSYVPLWGSANGLDPGPSPDLPELTTTEEQLLARVHVNMEMRQHRGQQYKYRGHICHFAVNTAKVFSRLPLFPHELDIIILKPAATGGEDQGAINRQFKKEHRVRRPVVKQWLDYLIANHPGYADVTINVQALSSLPINDYINDQLIVIETNNEGFPADVANGREDESSNAQEQPSNTISSLSNTSGSSGSFAPSTDEFGGIDDDDLGVEEDGQSNYGGSSTFEELEVEEVEDPEHGFVPNFAPDAVEFDTLRNHIRRTTNREYLSMASIRRTPISEFNNREPLLSLAFPSLFPNGQAEFIQPRLREVDYLGYVRHLLCYKDGRFARHPRFRFAAFNMLLRRESAAKAGFYVRRTFEGQDMTVEDVQDEFTGEDGGQRMIDSIVRFMANIRGTQSFWTREGKSLEAMVCLIPV